MPLPSISVSGANSTGWHEGDSYDTRQFFNSLKIVCQDIEYYMEMQITFLYKTQRAGPEGRLRRLQDSSDELKSIIRAERLQHRFRTYNFIHTLGGADVVDFYLVAVIFCAVKPECDAVVFHIDFEINRTGGEAT